MTFQTSPYMPWIFPDEAYDMNNKGLKFSHFPPSHLNAEVGHESPWAQHERQVAMDRVHNTQRNQRGMEGHLNTTERSQRYTLPASRSSVPNGVFHGSPMTYLTSAGLRGGRIYTKEGQEWLAKRLKQRIGELDAISTGNFSAGMPQPIALSPYTNVDTLLSQLFASFGVGSLTSSTVQALNQLLSEFIKIGAVITPSQLTKYAQAVQQLGETIRPYAGRELGAELGPVYEGQEKRRRFTDQINKTLKVIDGVIREIARTINDPLSGRQQVMATLQSRLLGAQMAQFNPEFAGPERQQAARNVPAELPPLGGPLLGEFELEQEAPAVQFEQQPLGRFPEQELAMNEAEAYAGQGKRRGRPRKYKY